MWNIITYTSIQIVIRIDSQLGLFNIVHFITKVKMKLEILPFSELNNLNLVIFKNSYNLHFVKPTKLMTSQLFFLFELFSGTQ